MILILLSVPRYYKCIILLNQQLTWIQNTLISNMNIGYQMSPSVSNQGYAATGVKHCTGYLVIVQKSVSQEFCFLCTALVQSVYLSYHLN